MKNLLYDPDKDKNLYRDLIAIGIPIAIQNLISASLNMIDTIMIGQLGETEIAAVGLANQIFFLLNLFLFGICSGTAIFIAQFWGKKDIKNIRKVIGLSLICGIFVSGIFTLIALFAPGKALAVFTKDKNVISMGSQYLEIVGLSYIITAITYSYAFALRNTGQPKIPMFISGVAVTINAVFNYIFIFGKLGLPAMGIRGAAIATVIARVVEVSLVLTIVYKNEYEVAARFSDIALITADFIKKFFHTTMPVILNEMLWSLGIAMYSMVYARMGTSVIAAVNIASTVEQISMVLFIGMSNACAFIVGNEIGTGNEDNAFYYAKKIVLLGPITGIIIGTILIICSDWFLSVYRVSEFVHWAAKSMLIACATIMPLRIFNMINIVGILRSGGDTKFSLFIDASGVWLMGVPVAFILGLVLKLPISLVYGMVIFAEQTFKFAFGIRRFITKKWINNLVYNI